MSSINEVVLEGYVLGYEDKGNYGLAKIVVDKYDFNSKGFTEMTIDVVVKAGQKGLPPADKLVDGKPVRFKGEVAIKKDGTLGVSGFLKLHYLGKFEAKPQGSAPASAASASYADEPPF